MPAVTFTTDSVDTIAMLDTVSEVTFIELTVIELTLIALTVRIDGTDGFVTLNIP